MLAVSGQLIDRMGGPATARAEVGHKRRTMYSTISRREPDKMLVAFDFPDANVTTERRNVTTVPQQQLFVLNSDFMSDAAAAVARKVTEEETGTGERFQLLYKLMFCREPTRDESVAAEDFVQGATKAGEGEPPVWNQLVQAMLAANEFCWID